MRAHSEQKDTEAASTSENPDTAVDQEREQLALAIAQLIAKHWWKQRLASTDADQDK